ncbi:MAG: 50S ribosomal protein L4 [Clostridia bacterium]|nr:50S ribosomal protein L4 [Clostridia bacterium]
MPEIKVLNMAGKEVGTMTLSDKVFGAEVNTAVLHAAVVAYLSNQRQGTQSTLTRTEVSGGGKKPWRQKGSGRARQGSTRAPQWTHGGVALGPKPRLYKVKLNKKVKRVAMFSALSAKASENELIVIDKIEASEYKTKTMAKMLADVKAGKKALVVLPECDDKAISSLRNIEGVKVSQWNTLNVYDILNCESLVASQDAINKIQEVYDK